MDLAGISPVACPSCGGPGTGLSTASMAGSPIAGTTTLGWTSGSATLSTAGNTNGKVTLLIDLRGGVGMAGYSAFHNLVIARSDTPGDTGGGGGTVPEPTTLMLAGLAAMVLGLRGRPR